MHTKKVLMKFQKPKRSPSRQELKMLKKEALLRHQDFLTEIIVGDEMGIKGGITRHLQWTDIHDKTITFGDPKALHPLQRKMPNSTVKYFGSLKREDDYVCPYAHRMTTNDHSNVWYRIFELVNHEISLLSLCWPYQDAHEDDIESEYRLAHLRWLAKKYLENDEIRTLEMMVAEWERLPPTIQLNRLPTRAENLRRRTEPKK